MADVHIGLHIPIQGSAPTVVTAMQHPSQRNNKCSSRNGDMSNNNVKSVPTPENLCDNLQVQYLKFFDDVVIIKKERQLWQIYLQEARFAIVNHTLKLSVKPRIHDFALHCLRNRQVKPISRLKKDNQVLWHLKRGSVRSIKSNAGWWRLGIGEVRKKVYRPSLWHWEAESSPPNTVSRTTLQLGDRAPAGYLTFHLQKLPSLSNRSHWFHPPI